MKINFREIREISKKLDNDMVFIQSGVLNMGFQKKKEKNGQSIVMPILICLIFILKNLML
jgi:hypothetical protein